MKMQNMMLVALLAAGTAAAQECPGDVDGSGEVTVDEIVASVQSALNGCPADPPTPTPDPSPTPTPELNPDWCEFNFLDDTTGSAVACRYSGTAPGCGVFESTFVSDGVVTIVMLSTGGFSPEASVSYYAAEVRGASSGSILGQWARLDMNDFSEPPGGAPTAHLVAIPPPFLTHELQMTPPTRGQWFVPTAGCLSSGVYRASFLGYHVLQPMTMDAVKAMIDEIRFRLP